MLKREPRRDRSPKERNELKARTICLRSSELGHWRAERHLACGAAFFYHAVLSELHANHSAEILHRGIDRETCSQMLQMCAKLD